MGESGYKRFPLPGEVEVTELVSLFHLECPQDFVFEGEAHGFWELVYIDKGRLLVTAGDKPYLLKAGELAFHKPGEFHALRACGVPATAIVASFACQNPCMRYFEHRFTALTAGEREYLYEALRCASPLLDGGFAPEAPRAAPFGGAQLVRANLELLLLHLIRRGGSDKIQKRVESYFQRVQAQRTAERVNAYLEAGLSQKLTLGKIASELGYSVSQMKKLYRRETGRGVVDALIALKIDAARRLLREGNMNISQVAEYLGYESPAYFSRQFRRRAGLSPSEFARSLPVLTDT